MSIRNTAELVSMARREGLMEAVEIVERESDRVMRVAHGHHKENHYDEYEHFEGQATRLTMMAERIRRRAKRRRSVSAES